MGLLHITVFFSLYTILYSFHFLRRCSPTRTPTSLYKTPVICKLRKSIQIISLKVHNYLFFFLFCFEKTSNDLFLTYEFEYDCCSQIFAYKTERRLLMTLRNGAKSKKQFVVPTITLSSMVQGQGQFETNSLLHTSP